MEKAFTRSDYEKMKLPELKNLLVKRGFTKTGRKVELVDRLLSDNDYSILTIPKLKALLATRGLSIKGKKKELVARLEQKSSHKRVEFEPGETILTGVLDVDRLILLELDDASLWNACRINKLAVRVCKTDKFWRERIERVFGHDLSEYKNEENTYRKMYRELRTYQEYGIDRFLVRVAELGYLPIVEDLINAEAIPIDSGYFNVALQKASENGHLQVVTYLIGSDNDIRQYYLNASLINASKNGHLWVVKYLVENGADIRANYSSALSLAVENGHLPIVKHLIEKGADDSSALSSAAYYEHLPIIKYLMKKGAIDHDTFNGALRTASAKGNLHVVKYLIEQRTDSHAMSEGLDTALRRALQNKHLYVSKYLVEQGADVYTANLTVNELKDALHAWKLPVTGSKKVLINRILEALGS